MSDLIDRRDAIYAAVEAADEWGGGMNPERAKIIGKAILNLPSVQPEQKHGMWIRLSNNLAQCSECKDYINNAISCGYNYCPNCGAEMDMKRE